MPWWGWVLTGGGVIGAVCFAAYIGVLYVIFKEFLRNF